MSSSLSVLPLPLLLLTSPLPEDPSPWPPLRFQSPSSKNVLAKPPSLLLFCLLLLIQGTTKQAIRKKSKNEAPTTDTPIIPFLFQRLFEAGLVVVDVAVGEAGIDNEKDPGSMKECVVDTAARV